MEIFSIAITSSLLTVMLISFIIFIARASILKYIQYSIKYEYDKKLIKIEHEKEIRLKAELVAELMAEWLKKDVDYHKLNELSFKAFLWLPSDIAIDLSNSLSHKENSPDVREMIWKVRKHLLGDEDTIQFPDVIIFKDPTT